MSKKRLTAGASAAAGLIMSVNGLLEVILPLIAAARKIRAQFSDEDLPRLAVSLAKFERLGKEILAEGRAWRRKRKKGRRPAD